MADTEEKVNRAKQAIHNVVETAASIPEGQNQLKRNQLRELAALNGTLRDDENQACQNCGEIGHRKYDCPQQRNFTANIICRVCGNAGHMARDCPDRQRGQDWRNGPPPVGGRPTAGRIGGGDAVDREYDALMQELSGGAAIENGAPQFKLENGTGGYDNGPTGDNVKPWQRGPTGAPAPWKTGGAGGGGGFSGGDSGGGARPWASGPRGGRGGGDGYGGGYNNYGGGRDNYGAGSGGAASWQQGSAAPPPPPGGQQYGGYGYGQGAYDQYSQGGAAPPPPPSVGGYGYQVYGNSGSPAPPPPPPAGDVPPPPPPA